MIEVIISQRNVLNNDSDSNSSNSDSNSSNSNSNCNSNSNSSEQIPGPKVGISMSWETLTHTKYVLDVYCCRLIIINSVSNSDKSIF